MPSTELRAQLRAFADALSARTIDAADLSVLAGDAALARRRFGLYRGNVLHNVARALASAYPVVRALVGEAFFDALARAHASAHPSRDGDLNETGESFAAFLSAFQHVADLPYLPDVAALEWRVHRAHAAADATALDVGALAAVPAERLAGTTLVLHPACAIVSSRWPIAAIWRAHQPSHGGAIAVDLDAGPEHALVFRPAWRVDVEGLDEGGHAFLAACLAGASLERALSAAVCRDAAFDLQGALARWVGSAVVVGFLLPAGVAREPPSLNA